MINHKKRILVVDDEVTVTRWLKINLELKGNYLVCTENSAVHAHNAALEFHPDLVIMDIMMPEMGGEELAIIFSADHILKSVPIVFLTALTTKGEVKKSGGLIGGKEFLAKPVDMQEVMNCIKSHLGE